MRVAPLLFILACVAANATDSDVIAPSCAQPARLENHFEGSPYITVVLKPSAKDRQSVVRGLSRKYGFQIIAVYHAVNGFTVSLLSPEEIAKLRCEPEVDTVTYDQKVSISGRSVNAGR